VENIKKALILGDVHGRDLYLANAIALARAKGLDAIIQVGDYGYWPGHADSMTEPMGLPVYWVDGNHENHEQLKQFREPVNEIAENLYYIPRGTVHEIQNKQVLFMGGAYSIDKEYRTPGLDWFPEETIGWADMQRAMGHDKADIVIAHDCPAEIPILTDTYQASIQNRSLLSMLLDNYRPEYWFFGHYHRTWKYYHEQTETAFYCVEEAHAPGAVAPIFDFVNMEIKGMLVLNEIKNGQVLQDK
jgi:hypothetical protein